MNGVILLDLMKAFNLIDHNILIQKLRLYKCSDITIDWFTSNIKGRSQFTIYKDTLPIKKGVHQGPILDPLLFIIVLLMIFEWLFKILILTSMQMTQLSSSQIYSWATKRSYHLMLPKCQPGAKKIIWLQTPPKPKSCWLQHYKNVPHDQKMKINLNLKWMVNTWKMLNLKNYLVL